MDQVPKTSWEQFVYQSCSSIWEGCACLLPRGHGGAHECCGKACSCAWTDAAGKEYMRSRVKGS